MTIKWVMMRLLSTGASKNPDREMSNYTCVSGPVLIFLWSIQWSIRQWLWNLYVQPRGAVKPNYWPWNILIGIFGGIVHLYQSNNTYNLVFKLSLSEQGSRYLKDNWVYQLSLKRAYVNMYTTDGYISSSLLEDRVTINPKETHYPLL